MCRGEGRQEERDDALDVGCEEVQPVTIVPTLGAASGPDGSEAGWAKAVPPASKKAAAMKRVRTAMGCSLRGGCSKDISRNVPTPRSFEINDLRELLRPHADDSGTACVRFRDTSIARRGKCTVSGLMLASRRLPGCATFEASSFCLESPVLRPSHCNTGIDSLSAT
jgi:hypothetical protein